MKKLTKNKILVTVSIILALALVLGIVGSQMGFFAVTACPTGTTTPYCSNLDLSTYQKCIDGITYKYPCPSGTSCSNGACVAPNTCPAGTTSYYCSNLDLTSRQICNNGITYKYPCPSGQTCKDGNCVSTYTCPLGTTNYYCSSLDLTSRMKCNSATGMTEKFPCLSGQTCKDGSCVYPPCPAGTTSYYCSNLNLDVRLRCENGITKQYACSSGTKCSNGVCVGGTYASYCASVPKCNGINTAKVTCDSNTGKTTTTMCNTGLTCVNGECINQNAEYCAKVPKCNTDNTAQLFCDSGTGQVTTKYCTYKCDNSTGCTNTNCSSGLEECSDRSCKKDCGECAWYDIPCKIKKAIVSLVVTLIELLLIVVSFVLAFFAGGGLSKKYLVKKGKLIPFILALLFASAIAIFMYLNLSSWIFYTIFGGIVILFIFDQFKK